MASPQNDPHWLARLPLFIRRRIKGRPHLQQVISNTGWLIADNLLRMLIGLIVGIWVARYLGPASFGELNYALWKGGRAEVTGRHLDLQRQRVALDTRPTEGNESPGVDGDEGARGDDEEHKRDDELDHHRPRLVADVYALADACHVLPG